MTLDVMMPNVDGWSVLAEMKSDPALAHIPVIMLTIVDDRNLGWSLGASEYMTKPIDRERLVALVHRFTNRSADAVVLIVDDDPEVRNVVSATLRNAGLKAAEAVNGRAALEWLAGNPPPNLVLLDLMMPEMDGFQFLERSAGASRQAQDADRRADREGPDRRGTSLSCGTNRSGAGQVRAADRKPRRRLCRRSPRKGTVPTIPAREFRKRQTDGGRMPKILLVEDNEMNRDMLSRRLVRNGFEVVIAVDGGQGVAMATSEKPDLILMDMSLPVLDGWEATRRVKADPATKAIPVIALTAHAMAEDKEKSLAAGCDDFDTKPVELPRLLGKIQALLGK